MIVSVGLRGSAGRESAFVGCGLRDEERVNGLAPKGLAEDKMSAISLLMDYFLLPC